MLDWIRHAEEVLERWYNQREAPPERDLLILMLKGMHHMALDLTKLNASVARLSGDVDGLIAALPDPAKAAADQAAVDAVAATLDTVSAKAEPHLPPPPAPAPAPAA